MKNKLSRTKIVAGSLVILAMAIAGFLFVNKNNSLNEKLKESKLKSEMLLSEKLNLDKQIEQLNKNSQDLQNRINLLSKDLENKNNKLAEKEKELSRLAWNVTRSKQLEKELKKMKDLENQIIELNAVIASLRAANESAVGESITLREQNQNLSENNRLLLALNANNYRIDAVRGKKNKQTAIAKRTRKIVMGFDIPEDVVENVNFKITTPEGKIVSNEKDGLSYIVINNNDYLLASISSQSGIIEMSKRIELTYKPEKKLPSGIYKIDIYNNGDYMGSCQVKLR